MKQTKNVLIRYTTREPEVLALLDKILEGVLLADGNNAWELQLTYKRKAKCATVEIRPAHDCLGKADAELKRRQEGEAEKGNGCDPMKGAWERNGKVILKEGARPRAGNDSNGRFMTGL